jgi:hypothetical protein
LCARDQRWADTTTRNDKVIVIAHPPGSFNDLIFIVADDLHPFQGYTEVEAPFRHVRGIGIGCLQVEWTSLSGLGLVQLCGTCLYLAAEHFIPYYYAAGRPYHPLPQIC